MTLQCFKQVLVNIFILFLHIYACKHARIIYMLGNYTIKILKQQQKKNPMLLASMLKIFIIRNQINDGFSSFEMNEQKKITVVIIIIAKSEKFFIFYFLPLIHAWIAMDECMRKTARERERGDKKTIELYE